MYKQLSISAVLVLLLSSCGTTSDEAENYVMSKKEKIDTRSGSIFSQSSTYYEYNSRVLIGIKYDEDNDGVIDDTYNVLASGQQRTIYYDEYARKDMLNEYQYWGLLEIESDFDYFDATTKSAWRYTRDEFGNILYYEYDSDGDGSFDFITTYEYDYEYDGQGRVVKEIAYKTSESSSYDREKTYTYDSVSGRVSKRVDYWIEKDTKKTNRIITTNYSWKKL